MKKYIRKADIILFIVLVATGLAASAVLAMQGGTAGERVVIESGGELYATYSLAEDRTVAVPAPKQSSIDTPGTDAGSADTTDISSSDGPGSTATATGYDYYNVVEISGGKVSVIEASCKNQVCVHHAAISNSGETIVCLPNRLLVRIEGGKGGGYDTVTS